MRERALRSGAATSLIAVVFLMTAAACGGGGAVVDPPDGVTENPPEPANPGSGGTGAGGTGGTGGAGTGTGGTGTGGTGGGSVVVTTSGSSFVPSSVTIGQGGTVTWQISGATHNVTFGASAPTGGNIPDMSSGSATRNFPTAGTFTYVCTRHSGMSGQVVVTGADGTPPPGTPPSSPGILVQATPSAFTPDRVEVPPGSTIVWEITGGSMGIVFEDDAPPGGNIPESAPGTRVSRTFPAEGSYDYYSSRNSRVEGRIRVR